MRSSSLVVPTAKVRQASITHSHPLWCQSYAIETRPRGVPGRTGTFLSGDGNLLRIHKRPVNQVRRGFDHASAQGVAAQDKLEPVQQTLFMRHRQWMHTKGFRFSFMPAAIGHHRLMQNAPPLCSGDEILSVESPRVMHHTANVFRMILPWAIARTKLRNAATVSVHHRAGRRVWTAVAIVWHAIAISVAGRNMGSGAADQETAALDHRAKGRQSRAVNVEVAKRTVLLRRRAARILPHRQEALAVKGHRRIIGYKPGGLSVVAGVVSVTGASRTEGVSPATKPK